MELEEEISGFSCDKYLIGDVVGQPRVSALFIELGSRKCEKISCFDIRSLLSYANLATFSPFSNTICHMTISILHGYINQSGFASIFGHLHYLISYYHLGWIILRKLVRSVTCSSCYIFLPLFAWYICLLCSIHLCDRKILTYQGIVR